MNEWMNWHAIRFLIVLSIMKIKSNANAILTIALITYKTLDKISFDTLQSIHNHAVWLSWNLTSLYVCIYSISIFLRFYTIFKSWLLLRGSSRRHRRKTNTICSETLPSIFHMVDRKERKRRAFLQLIFLSQLLQLF